MCRVWVRMMRMVALEAWDCQNEVKWVENMKNILEKLRGQAG